MILEISRRVEGIPRVLGYSWEGGLNSENRPITLLDMLGQSIRLPLELCRTRNVRLAVHPYLIFIELTML